MAWGWGSMGMSGIEQHGVWWGSKGGGWGRAACGVLPITKVTLNV